MYDAACLPDPQTLQRAVGELVVSVRRRGDNTVLDGLRQVGCLKARFPRAVVAGWSDVVTLNTSGGIAADDRLESTFGVRAGARASIAAQAAERLYRALPGNKPSRVRTRIAVESGAAAEWLPQETILFDRCMLDRRIEVDIAEDAWFLGVESLIFGRAAMGETVEHAWLHDVIHIRRDRRLLWHDAMRLEGDVSEILRRKTVADGACAIATLVHVARDAEAALDPVRAVLPDAAGASAWNGMLIARILASSSATLRTSVTTVLRVLRGQRPLPRVWMC
jgi:urease accessory protein